MKTIIEKINEAIVKGKLKEYNNGENIFNNDFPYEYHGININIENKQTLDKITDDSKSNISKFIYNLINDVSSNTILNKLIIFYDRYDNTYGIVIYVKDNSMEAYYVMETKDKSFDITNMRCQHISYDKLIQELK